MEWRSARCCASRRWRRESTCCASHCACRLASARMALEACSRNSSHDGAAAPVPAPAPGAARLALEACSRNSSHDWAAAPVPPPPPPPGAEASVLALVLGDTPSLDSGLVDCDVADRDGSDEGPQGGSIR